MFGAAFPGSQSETPVPVDTSVVFKKIDLSANHVCALSYRGKIYCWGDRHISGTTPEPFNPIELPTPIISDESYTDFDLGFHHSCAITDSGFIDCWGIGTEGELGDGFASSRYLPTRVDSPGDIRFRKLALGKNHTCAISTSGLVYCWGATTEGRTGHGPVVEEAQQLSPKQVSSHIGVVQLDAGLSHTCGLTAEGTPLCWGKSRTTNYLTPTSIPLDGSVSK
jgi:alpha-tubulin suppressor-like RCC1 family protein